ncbi:MAG: hypothetical protein BGO63_03655 [Candidatus Accumulibacter sp. 66-26]|nr:MAG: hypothetical protein BGO63_03655 [Candidatus Accumulibacter sp. 66-26]
MSFNFEATTFVQPGYGQAPGDWSKLTQAGINKLRGFYPELSHWGDLALGCAFGSFSQDFMEVNWAEWMLEQRDEAFLSYCCWRQTRGAWRNGFDEDTLLEAVEWKN